MIVHCASAADYRRPQRDVTQTRRLLDAVRGGRPHLVYVSIVGVDRIPFVFRAKLDAERLVEDSGVPWTILRATQFHDLMLMFVMRLRAGAIALVPRNALLQPVDAGDVADRMAELVTGPAAGRVRQLGGPQVESMAGAGVAADSANCSVSASTPTVAARARFRASSTATAWSQLVRTALWPCRSAVT